MSFAEHDLGFTYSYRGCDAELDLLHSLCQLKHGVRLADPVEIRPRDALPKRARPGSWVICRMRVADEEGVAPVAGTFLAGAKVLRSACPQPVCVGCGTLSGNMRPLKDMLATVAALKPALPYNPDGRRCCVINILLRVRRRTAGHVICHATRVGLLLIPFALLGCGSGWDMTVTNDPGPSPFISFVHLSITDPSSVTGVQYTIAAKPGSVSKPVHVEYSIAALTARGYVSGGIITVPVIGLYAGYSNQVSMELTRQGDDPVQFEVDIATAPYVDPSGIYSSPNIVVKRAPGSSLGFDFIYVKSALGSPIILDTDGQIRWAAPGISDSFSSAFVGDSFIIGDPGQPIVYRLRLDGNVSQMTLPQSDYTDFDHDIDYGKNGLLAEVDAAAGGVEDNVIEIHAQSTVTIQSRWDLAAILSSYMSSHGDDAAAFVRPGVDWFHSNSAIYDPSDDSIIVSSRENFVIKLDYSTGAIKWILGDPTKYWYTFPSLRAKALTLAPGGLYPIGQHALSITPEGLLMLFNDGLGSGNQPAGQSSGQSRTYSAVSVYSIDSKSMTAREVWDYDAGQMIYSDICSSAYEVPGGSVLVDYAVANNATEALLVGLDPSHNVVFEFEFPTSVCSTSWNARPIALDALQIMR
jgi:arylsulfate sulfotransferase